jgi:hypothetical protein
MANEWTNADALRAFNTGATSDGVPQDVPGDSLGGYLSSSQVKTMKYVPNAIPDNIEVEYVSAANGEGTGALIFTGAAATWQAPGSATAGASVGILTGETKVLEDGESSEKYVRITKISAEVATLTGSLSLTFDENNAIVGDNVPEALALAGGSVYRAVGLDNGSAGTITGIKVFSGPQEAAVVSDNEFLPASGVGELRSSKYVGIFPDSGHFGIFSAVGALKEVVYAHRSTFGYDVDAADRGRCGTSATLGAIDDTFAPYYGAELALEVPVADQITAAADEETPPAAITFSSAFTEATAVTHASLAAGDWVGIHIKRDTAAASLQTPQILGGLIVMFTSGGTEYTVPFTDIFKVANAVEWQVWVSETSVVDFSLDPDATGTALPISVPLTPPGAGTKDYWYAVRYRNRYGLTSLNQYTRKVTVDAGGGEVITVPSSPYDTTLADSLEGDIEVRTNYLKGDDDGFAANRWSIWASVGVDPDPDVDTAVKTKGIPDINLIGDGLELVTDIGPYASGADVRVVVRVWRTSDLVTDGNTDVVTITTAAGPDAPEDVTAIM